MNTFHVHTCSTLGREGLSSITIYVDHLMLIPVAFKVQVPKGGNQNPYIEEEQTTQWPKEKVQTDKQRSTKHTHKTKDRVTRIPLKTEGEMRCSGRVSSSCSTSVHAVL
jgi:hypothetical protein